MIELIGYLLCVYMLIRGLDIGSRIEDRKSRTSTLFANISAAIAIIGSVIFFLLMVDEADSTPALDSPPISTPLE